MNKNKNLKLQEITHIMVVNKNYGQDDSYKKYVRKKKDVRG